MDRVLNLVEKLFKTQDGQLNILGKGINIILIIILIKVLIKIVNVVIDKTVHKRKKSIFSVDEKKD